MQARRHALLHQGVIGRVEFDKIRAVAAGVDDVKTRRIFIGEPTELDRLRRSEILAEFP